MAGKTLCSGQRAPLLKAAGPLGGTVLLVLGNAGIPLVLGRLRHVIDLPWNPTASAPTE